MPPKVFGLAKYTKARNTLFPIFFQGLRSRRGAKSHDQWVTFLSERKRLSDCQHRGNIKTVQFIIPRLLFVEAPTSLRYIGMRTRIFEGVEISLYTLS